MRLQEGEKILHELRPEAPILGIWFFTKCIPAGFAGAFLAMWFLAVFGVFAMTFGRVPTLDPHWPFSAGGITGLIGGPVLVSTAGTSGLPVFPFAGERAEITMVGLKDNETPATTIHGILKNFRATGE